jgi:hypothetical protein
MFKRVVMALLVFCTPALAGELERVPPLANAAAQKECGACHMAYQPQLLPADSWRKIFADFAHHFGENASLDDPLHQEILDYYVVHASRSAEGLAPLRITEQRWLLSAHGRVSQTDWRRQNSRATAPRATGRQRKGISRRGLIRPKEMVCWRQSFDVQNQSTGARR